MNAPGNAGRIATIQADGFKTVESQVAIEPVVAALLLDLAALFDAAAVEHHDRRHQARVVRAPPARRPVAAALLLECAVAQERDQSLARQRRVHIVQLRKTQVAAFLRAACGVGIDVRAQRRGRPTFGGQLIRVEVTDEPREARLIQAVARRVGR